MDASRLFRAPSSPNASVRAPSAAPSSFSASPPLYPLASAAVGRGGIDELVDKALNKTAAVQVVVRVRPLSSAELRAEDPEPVLRVANEFRNDFRVLEAVVGHAGDRETVRRFTFDRVAPPETTQRELFDLSGVKELMEAALTGLNVSVFAYGQTGSGKTYTMSGVEERITAAEASATDSTMGIIPRAISHLYSRIAEDPEGSTTTVRVSFAEIYNEVRRGVGEGRARAGAAFASKARARRRCARVKSWARRFAPPLC